MQSGKKRDIIIVTDGDKIALQTIQLVAFRVGGRCISQSAGNPTPLTGGEIVEQILQAKYDPVFVMFDDNGHKQLGDGERALNYVAVHPQINVLGAIAVASNTEFVEGAKIDLAVTSQGKIVHCGVNKYGDVEISSEKIIYGDTVGTLNHLDIPIIVGIGDIGKMNGRDDFLLGAPITFKAVEIILKRSGLDAGGAKNSN